MGYFSLQTIFFLKELHKINTYIIHWHLISCTKLHVVSWCINLLWKKKLNKKNKKIYWIFIIDDFQIFTFVLLLLLLLLLVLLFFSVSLVYGPPQSTVFYIFTQNWHKDDNIGFTLVIGPCLFFLFFFEKPTKTIKHTINHNYRHKKSP